MSQDKGSQNSVDVVIVGAGFSGLYLIHRLRNEGYSLRVFERGDGVGGTWYWNRYPGARCDVESMQYSYSFDEQLQQDWHWPEKFSAQPDILEYANRVADRFDLRKEIEFETAVTAAHFDEAAGRWRVETDKGEKVSARFFIMATGCISTAQIPDIAGLSLYQGNTYHTGKWPHEKVDFTGQRIAVIGTGSSGIQAIPVLAEEAAHLTVFQRTANYSLPAQNMTMTPEYEGEWKDDYRARRMEMRYTPQGSLKDLNDEPALAVSEDRRREVYTERWATGGATLLGAFNNLLIDQKSNDTAAAFVRQQIRKTVKDPATAELLCPKDHPIGTKRICIDSGYYQTFNRDNVELVDIKKSPIERITATGLIANGRAFEFDSIVFATGFDAMTGALTAVDIRGKEDASLRERWADGPISYLGLAMADFPNLFTVTGPGSPSVFTNMLPTIEQHVDWITDCLAWMQDRNYTAIEAEHDAERAWWEHHQEVATVGIKTTTDSWYLGANVHGKARVFMPYYGGFPDYCRKCEEVVADGYAGFAFG